MAGIDRAELVEILSDPEFEKQLTRARMLRKQGPTLSRAEDFDLEQPDG
jgi:hypothetical protein